MHNQPDVGTLLSAVADYGMTIIPADGIAIIKRTAGGFQPVVIREVYEPDIVGVEQVVELVAAEGGFQHVHRVDDLSQDRRWGKLPLPGSLRTWRSFLMVASERQTQTNAPVTFVWWSRRTSAFADQTDIAVLFARAAGLPIHIVDARDNLVQAVLARHRAGVAQGILMSRLGCSQDQAIAILKHRSQRTNRKVRIIADEVIQIGDLKPAPTNERDRLREPGTRSAGQQTDSCGSPRRFSVPLTMCQTRKAVAILEPWSVLRPRDFAWASASLASDSSRESRGATSGC